MTDSATLAAVLTHPFTLGFAAGAWISGKVGYNLAIRANGRSMVRTGIRRAVKGRW
jgi:hypothetical protein